MPVDSRIAEAFRRLFQAEVYLPWPAAIALLFSLIVFSASLTVILTYWPGSPPDLQENPRIALLEAELGHPLSSPISKGPDLDTPKPAAGYPVSALGLEARPMPLRDEQMVARQNPLPVRHAKAAGESKGMTPPQIVQIEISAANTPDKSARMEAEAMPPFVASEAVATGVPVADLAPGHAAAPDVAVKSEAAQKLLPRKYAAATSSPERLPSPSAGMIPADELFPSEREKAWQRFAAAVPSDTEGKPKIVIVIDDLGNAPAMTEALASLEGPLTL
ncbi:MAG TPA: hypothetical protein VD713_05040, partial [Sphingomonadales bacterium]|nr:hypothetical protein [Sphingomonadales bacterium]